MPLPSRVGSKVYKWQLKCLLSFQEGDRSDKEPKHLASYQVKTRQTASPQQLQALTPSTVITPNLSNSVWWPLCIQANGLKTNEGLKEIYKVPFAIPQVSSSKPVTSQNYHQWVELKDFRHLLKEWGGRRRGHKEALNKERGGPDRLWRVNYKNNF